MKQITTHILDTSAGRPASGVKIRLLQEIHGTWEEIGKAITNLDGRIDQWTPCEVSSGALDEPGTFKLIFETASYFQKNNIATFYPYVEIVFIIDAPRQHYHVPLLLNPFGYSTYRGS